MPCQNGASCSSIQTKPYFLCSCVNGFVGSTCATLQTGKFFKFLKSFC